MDLTKAIEMAPTFSSSFFSRGNSKYDLEDFKGAIEDYTKAIELMPDFPEAYFNRGLSKIYTSQKEEGCLDLSRAGELGDGKAYEVIKKHCTN